MAAGALLQKVTSSGFHQSWRSRRPVDVQEDLIRVLLLSSSSGN